MSKVIWTIWDWFEREHSQFLQLLFEVSNRNSLFTFFYSTWSRVFFFLFCLKPSEFLFLKSVFFWRRKASYCFFQMKNFGGRWKAKSDNLIWFSTFDLKWSLIMEANAYFMFVIFSKSVFFSFFLNQIWFTDFKLYHYRKLIF